MTIAGERDCCAMCGRPIMFNGVEWFHTEAPHYHRAEPRSEQREEKDEDGPDLTVLSRWF